MAEFLPKVIGKGDVAFRFVRRLSQIAIAVVFVLILFSEKSYANAGTALMWLTAGHMFFGNAVIGIVEGLVIALTFKSGIIRSTLVMVLANYVSMIAGASAVGLLEDWFSTVISINNLLFSIIVLAVVLFALTILIEWPFCWWILKGRERRWFRAICAGVLVNVVSYAALVPLYTSVSGTSLITELDASDVAKMTPPVNVHIYYIDESERTVCRIRPDGSETQVLTFLDETMSDPELALCMSAGAQTIALRWLERSEKGNVRKWKVAADSIPGSYTGFEFCDSLKWWRTEVSDLRGEITRTWEVKTGFWAISGLSAVNQSTGEELRFALETPFLLWSFSNATVLPGDIIICELGKQVVLIDLNTRRIGLVAFGKSPVVVLDQ